MIVFKTLKNTNISN